MAARAHVPSRLSQTCRSSSCPTWPTASTAADIDRNIQLLIRNLVEIKDTSGEFLLRLRRRPRHRHQGLERLGVDPRRRPVRHLEVLPADARRALPRDHARTGSATASPPGTPTKNINTVAPFLTLAYLHEEKPEQRLAALSRRMGRVAHGRPAAHRGERLPAHRVQLREPPAAVGRHADDERAAARQDRQVVRPRRTTSKKRGGSSCCTSSTWSIARPACGSTAGPSTAATTSPMRCGRAAIAG